MKPIIIKLAFKTIYSETDIVDEFIDMVRVKFLTQDKKVH